MKERESKSKRKLKEQKICPVIFILEDDGSITEEPNPDYIPNKIMNPTIKAQVHHLEIGEKIQKGDFWYSKFTDTWHMYNETPRTLLGFTQKKKFYHSIIVRVYGLENVELPTDVKPEVRSTSEKIFSGDESFALWDEINRIDEFSPHPKQSEKCYTR